MWLKYRIKALSNLPVHACSCSCSLDDVAAVAVVVVAVVVVNASEDDRGELTSD